VLFLNANFPKYSPIPSENAYVDTKVNNYRNVPAPLAYVIPSNIVSATSVLLIIHEIG
jgi:hypothetical protein